MSSGSGSMTSPSMPLSSVASRWAAARTVGSDGSQCPPSCSHSPTRGCRVSSTRALLDVQHQGAGRHVAGDAGTEHGIGPGGQQAEETLGQGADPLVGRGLGQLAEHGGRVGVQGGRRLRRRLRVGPAQRDRLGRPETEQVGVGAADQLARAGAVVGRPAVPAHDRHGHAGQLALHQIAGRGQLVGHRHLRHPQLVAEPVDLAAGIGQGRQPGHADREVDDAAAPRAAHRVGDHDRDVRAGPLGQLGPQPRPRTRPGRPAAGRSRRRARWIRRRRRSP